MPASIRLDSVCFSYSDAVPVLSEITLHLRPGWTGLVGANGEGKSTLLALLAGRLRPVSGRIRHDPLDARVVACDQSVATCPDGVARLARSRDGSARALLGTLRLDPARAARWDELSPGERRRWQIAAALAAEPDVLLLDEPGDHLDEEARAWLVATLRGFPGVGVLVSHDRALLDALCVATVRLHRGGATLAEGGYSHARAVWEEATERRREEHARLGDEARKARARLADARRKSGSAERSRSTGARMNGRYDSDARGMGAQLRVDWAAARAGRGVEVARAASERAAAALGESRFEADPGRSVAIAWEPPPRPWVLALDAPEVRAGERRLCGRVSLAVGRADRVRLVGPNGAGKTTLLRALLEASPLPPGRLLYLPQELPDGQGRAWIAEIAALPGPDRGAVWSLVAALGASPPRLQASSDPSPGEARKLAIALGLTRGVWALVLDECTNHLDLPSIERLEDALARWPGALVLVSHDAAFAERLTRREWRIGHEGLRET